MYSILHGRWRCEFRQYSYLQNNPLSYTDPSGHSFLGTFRALLSVAPIRIVVTAVVAFYTGQYVGGYVGLLTGNTTLAVAAGGFAGGFAVGGINSGTFQGAFIGGLTGSAFSYIGGAANLTPYGRVALRGATGGAVNRARGGSFKEGFLSAAVVAFANVKVSVSNPVYGLIKSSLIGGIAAKLGGGKFDNGAATGAFSYLFADALQGQRRRVANEQFDEFMERLSELGLDRGPYDPFIVKPIATSLTQLPDSIINFEPRSLWGQIVESLGSHSFNQRLPEGFHLTVDEGLNGVFVHKDFFNPLNGILDTFRHINIETGNRSIIRQNKILWNPDN